MDLNNCLSVELAVPCCVVAEGSFTPPVILRAGSAGESYESLRGPFNLEGKPLLADAEGPFGTPITDSQRVKVREGDRRAWMVAYLPRDILTPEAGQSALNDLLAAAPVAPARGDRSVTMTRITHLFTDLGGVLLTNGWDRGLRKLVALALRHRSSRDGRAPSPHLRHL